jgi:hypothetical protein
MPRTFVLLAALLSPLLLTSFSYADVITYDVTGYIDTSDYLFITGSTLQWYHNDTGGAAVGRHAGNNFPTVISSTLNGSPQLVNFDWIPTWPRAVPDEIRFEAYSSTLNSLTPALPAVDGLNVQLAVISGRGSISLTELPVADDNYTLVVQFKDGFNGSANLDALITVTTTPEPASLTLLASAPLLLRRRK